MEINTYKTLFLDYLNHNFSIKEPKNLYDPIDYILKLGGKRLRPVLTLMACDIFNGKPKEALPAAFVVEMFHNFSLIHDDIMDAAPLRRGKPPVHVKWNLNTGILSGDAMLVMAHKHLEHYDSTYKKLTCLLNKTAIEVCEGQQYDFDFETRNDVTVADYIKMIKLKTSVLIGAALEFGAIVANANNSDCKNIYHFGLNLGLAFQLQDDYLDVYGKTDFGKQKGGDILSNKKTFLYLKTLSIANAEDKSLLFQLYQDQTAKNQKTEKVISLFNKYKIDKIIKNEVSKYTDLAITYLDKLSISSNKKQSLKQFAISLMGRKV